MYGHRGPMVRVLSTNVAEGLYAETSETVNGGLGPPFTMSFAAVS